MLKRFFKSKKGVSIVEYAVLAALVAVVAVGTASTDGLHKLGEDLKAKIADVYGVL